MKTRSHAIHNTGGDQKPPPQDHQQQQEFFITPNALKAMMEEAASRAAVEAIAHYLAAQRQNQGGEQNFSREKPQPRYQGKKSRKKRSSD